MGKLNRRKRGEKEDVNGRGQVREREQGGGGGEEGKIKGGLEEGK